jgi:hypothetical protein
LSGPKNKLTDAVSMAERGWQVFPCHSVKDEACTCMESCKSPAKHPVTAKGFNGAIKDPSLVRSVWEDLYWANIGLRTGPESGLWVLDLDGDAGIKGLEKWEAEHGPLPKTPTVRTGSGGRHLYFAYPPDVEVKCSTKVAGHSIDVRGAGGYVIAAGSTNLKGDYEWLVTPDEAPLTDSPEWLLRMVTERRSKPTSIEPAGRNCVESTGSDPCPVLDLDTDPGEGEGKRHDRACQLIGSHLAFGESKETVLAKALEWGKRCRPAMDDEEIRRIVRDFAAKDAVRRPAKSGIVAASTSWPVLDDAALYGLSGDVVRAIEPSTEADPVAILGQFHVYFGNVIGRSPYFEVEATEHHTNLFANLVGQTAKGRKGTSESWVRRLFKAVDRDWSAGRIQNGLSSGEGLIWAVRDPIEKIEPVKDKGVIKGYQQVVVDPGIDDKRLLVQESEFASILKVTRRDGNTLSTVVRDAWDSGVLRAMTKNTPARATGAHISIAGHITKEELLRCMNDVEGFNGFANRFLWLCVKRSKLLPEGGQPVDLAPYVERLSGAVKFATTAGRMARDEGATRLWAKVYEELATPHDGLFGAVTSRAEAQVLRLSMLYALLDASVVIRSEHLRAAKALWRYAEDSARYIFGGSTGDPLADKVLSIVRDGPVTTKEIHDKTHRRLGAKDISGALERLKGAGLICSKQIATGGRPAELWALN